MNKKKRILLSVIGILLLITSIVGVSYAYFTSMIAGNNEASPTVVTTGTMRIEYENSAEITGEQILPGWTSEEKTFTVKNTGTLPVNYSIRITNVINTFNKTINNVVGDPAELVLKLTRDGETILEAKQFPTVDSTIVSVVEIEPNTTHTYTMQITFKALGIAQNYNQGREFAGKIEIVAIEPAKTIAVEGDTSNANAPELNNGLIPVTWNGRNWVKADTTKAWYNYDNGAWANAVTVSKSTSEKYNTASKNTSISMDDIETMWVWVPRYEYQHTNLGGQYAGGTQAQPGGITINFISKDTTTPSSDNFTIHDAFWWDDNNDGVKDANEQLSGIWVAKFEMSAGSTICTPVTLSVGTDCDIVTINPMIKPNEESWRGARIGTMWTAIHNNMNGEDNQYGLTNTDAHLMKNMEWGAVAYLSQSKYGKYGNANYTGVDKEIYQNKSSLYITGSSNGTPSSNTTNIQVEYNAETSGTGASTTGNIYGIYDMSGGAFDYVMGIMKANNSNEPAVGNTVNQSSGWSGKLFDAGKWTFYTGTYGRLGDDETTKEIVEGIGSKYYDFYDYSTSSTATEARAHKGDATFETLEWYESQNVMISVNAMFFDRGGIASQGKSAGIFSFAKSPGYSMIVRSGRPALVPLN